MCDHLRTEITPPNHEGLSIKKCKDCSFQETIVAGFYEIDTLLANGQLKGRRRGKGDYAGSAELRHRAIIK